MKSGDEFVSFPVPVGCVVEPRIVSRFAPTWLQTIFLQKIIIKDSANNYKAYNYI